MNLSIEREWNNNTGLCLTDGLLGKKYTGDSSWTRSLLGLSPAGLMVPVEPVGTSCLLETPMEMLAKITMARLNILPPAVLFVNYFVNVNTFTLFDIIYFLQHLQTNL